VRVLQPRRGADLGEESLAAERGTKVGVEDLDGDVAVVAEVVGEVHRRHPAGAELALDAIALGQRRREAGEDVQCVLCGCGLRARGAVHRYCTCKGGGASQLAAPQGNGSFSSAFAPSGVTTSSTTTTRSRGDAADEEKNDAYHLAESLEDFARRRRRDAAGGVCD
jgi:hypothetical protein